MRLKYNPLYTLAGVIIAAMFGWIVSAFTGLDFISCFLMSLAGILINGLVIYCGDKAKHWHGEGESKE